MNKNVCPHLGGINKDFWGGNQPEKKYKWLPVEVPLGGINKEFSGGTEPAEKYKSTPLWGAVRLGEIKKHEWWLHRPPPGEKKRFLLYFANPISA